MVELLKTLEEFTLATTKKYGEKLVVVDFTASWCPPCQMIGPKFVAMAGEYEDVVFFKVDVDENADAAQHAGIEAMPTFQFFKNGLKLDQVRGADEQKLREAI